MTEVPLLKSIYTLLADALSAWIAGTVRTAGFHRVSLGMSGGVDSAVTAALCARALGPGNVLTVYMPCGSLPADGEDTAEAAGFLGTEYRVVDLDQAFKALVESSGTGSASRLTLANIRPRLRMTTLYALSEGRLVVGTGNYSEYLVGYSTKWGDSAADFHPLARLFKDEVRALAVELGLPGRIIDRVPSAGLWEGQSDEGEMGVTYGEIRSYFEDRPVDPVSASRIAQLHRASEHKRVPAPFFDARGWLAANA
jgi:NAD+ synthase